MSSTAPLTTPQLRQFAWIMATLIAAIFGLLFPLLKGEALPLIPWILSGIFVFLGVLIPRALVPVYRLWLKFGHILGFINSRIILTLIFTVIVTPMALVMKMVKRDTMARQFEPQQTTYRISSRPREVAHFEKPY